MCLGTEAKLLNAIMTVKGATMLSGYGIASYVNKHDGFFKSIASLVDIREKEIGYRIIGNKEDLSLILREDFCDVHKYKLSEM